MAKVLIKAGENPFIVEQVGTDGSNLFLTAINQVAAREGSGTLQFQARASGSMAFEDILDGDGAVIGELDFSAPVIFTVEGSINALQCDASGLSDDAWIEIVSI